jgi:NADPH:quinone reductase-like Zn-dependent oxidoreductase
MKGMAIENFGGNDKLKLLDLPDPEPAPDEVLIEIKAAGVGQWDRLFRSHELDLGVTQFPLILGWEGAGVVQKVGSKTKRFIPGDKVFYYDYPSRDRPRGSWAEKACVREDAVGTMPKTLSFREAGGLPIIALTAYQGLVDAIKVQTGNRVLITSGAGGVGSCAVQIASQLGAEVIALTSQKNMDFVSGLGANLVLDYHEDFQTELKARFPEGIDSVYNCTWSMETAGKAVEAIRQNGGFCTITDFPRELSDRTDVHFFRADVEPNGRQLEELARWVDSGKLKVFLQSVYPLSKAREALTEVEKGHVRGKVVLEIKAA